MFLLTDVYKLARSRYAKKVSLGDKGHEKTILVDANGPVLTAWSVDLDSDDQYLSKLATSELGSEIRAICCFKTQDGKQIAAALVDLSIELFELMGKPAKPLVHLLSVPFERVSGHLESLDIDPIVLWCSKGKNDYLFVYKYMGVLLILDVELLLLESDKKRSNTRLRNRHVRARTVSLGMIAVSLIAVKERQDHISIAVLYRDIDFNYSLRYYKFEGGSAPFAVERQMNVFSGAPSLVVSVTDGFMVVSDLKLWFFPLVNFQASIDDLAGDAAFPVSYNKLHNVVTLDMTGSVAPFMGSRFEAVSQIDPNRYLLVSDTGTTILVYLEVSSSSGSTTVKQFQIVDLGKSTIASDLVHLEDNVFFAGSLRSRLVIFRILPRHPFIDILSCVTDSSPILNMNLQASEHDSSLLLSRGGFHSGELELVSESPFRSAVVSLAVVKSEAKAMELSEVGSSRLVYLQGATGKRVEVYELPNLDRVELEKDERIIPEKPQLEESDGLVTLTWSIDKRRSLEYIQNGGTTLTLKSEHDVKIDLQDFGDLSSLIWHVDDEEKKDRDDLNVFALLWSGTLFHILFTKHKAYLIKTHPTGISGKTSLFRYQLGDLRYLIFIVDGEGFIFQVPISRTKGQGARKQSWDVKGIQYLKAKGSNGTFKASYNGHGPAFVYDDYSVFILDQTKQDRVKYALTKLHTFKNQILSCQHVESGKNQVSLAILFADGHLSHYQFTDRKGVNEAYSSNHLILLSVNISDTQLVSLQMETRPNLNTGQIDKMSSLILMDNHTLEVLHVYEPGDSCNFVDMCVMETQPFAKGPNYVVVANLVDDPMQMVKMFSVKLNRIEPFQEISLTGKVPNSFKFSRIACYGTNIMLAGEMSYLLKLKLSDDSITKVRGLKVKDFNNTPFFGADISFNLDLIALADSISGIFVGPFAIREMCLLPSPFKSHFATAVTVFKNHPRFVYGDAEGNIWCAERVERVEKGSFKTEGSYMLVFELLFHGNIGEQINHLLVMLEDPVIILVATVKGNVYRIQDLTYLLAGAFYNATANSKEGEDPLIKKENDFFENSFNILDGRYRFLPDNVDSSCPAQIQLESAKFVSDIKLLRP